jgi:dihydroxyacetone kinase-like protein
MKKFMNSPKNIVHELLEGYTLAYREKVRLAANNLVVRATPKAEGNVGIVAMAGSGHEPGICGFVGQGMLDVAVHGEIFAAPGPARCLEALKIAERGAGVLLLVLNHTGDVLTANVTLERATQANMHVKMLLVHDDISTVPRDEPDKRRGLVGCLPIYKIAGAAAEQGLCLDEVYTLAERIGNNMGTIAVASKTATHPSTGKAMFALGANEMEVGMGIHGEPGTGKTLMKTADETAEIMVAQLLDDLQVKPAEELLVIINGAGATSLLELFIIYRKVHHLLTDRQITVADCRIGEYMTTQEQAGFSIFFGRVDQELLRFWKAPCDAPYFTVR